MPCEKRPRRDEIVPHCLRCGRDATAFATPDCTRMPRTCAIRALRAPVFVPRGCHKQRPEPGIEPLGIEVRSRTFLDFVLPSVQNEEPIGMESPPLLVLS